MKIKEIYEYLDSIAPYNTQCEWDNSGLMCGSLDAETDSIMLALDCTNEVVEQAAKTNCPLIVCHHPLIFHPVSKVESGTPLYNAVREGVTVISCHTNLDMAKGGVNDVLADILGLGNTEVLYAEGKPLMRMGDTSYSYIKDFAVFCGKSLNNRVNYYDAGRTVKKVAVCGGAGGEYISEAFYAGCDTYVTGEAKHHEYLLAGELGINLIVAGHYSTENPVIKALYEKLSKAFPECSLYMAEQKCPYRTV